MNEEPCRTNGQPLQHDSFINLSHIVEKNVLCPCWAREMLPTVAEKISSQRKNSPHCESTQGGKEPIYNYTQNNKNEDSWISRRKKKHNESRHCGKHKVLLTAAQIDYCGPNWLPRLLMSFGDSLLPNVGTATLIDDLQITPSWNETDVMFFTRCDITSEPEIRSL